jgi:hypothetical protein
MKTRIHFEVLNSLKMVLNYRKNFVESCTINFMMQTAFMGTENRYWIPIHIQSVDTFRHDKSGTRGPGPKGRTYVHRTRTYTRFEGF